MVLSYAKQQHEMVLSYAKSFNEKMSEQLVRIWRLWKKIKNI